MIHGIALTACQRALFGNGFLIAAGQRFTDNSRLFSPAQTGNANRSRRRRRTAQYPLQEGDPFEASDDADAAFRVAHRRRGRRVPHQDVLANLPGRARRGRRTHRASPEPVAIADPCLLASTPAVLFQVPAGPEGTRPQARFSHLSVGGRRHRCDDGVPLRWPLHPRLDLAYRRARLARLLRGAGEAGGFALDHPGWSQGATVRVQTWCNPFVADVAAAHVAAGLCRQPRVVDRLGQIRRALAVLPDRDRGGNAAPGAAHHAGGGARGHAEGDDHRTQTFVWRGPRRVARQGGRVTELSVVVPVCNEAENVEPLAREIHAALAGRDYEMIFVDDGSTDDTGEILRRLKAE